MAAFIFDASGIVTRYIFVSADQELNVAELAEGLLVGGVAAGPDHPRGSARMMRLSPAR